MKSITINGIPISQSYKSALPYNPKLKERAKNLRYSSNLPEVLFWTRVSKGKFYGLDFDRQRIIGNYIVDFYVRQLSLVIEIDGASHDFDGDYDERRETYLISLGLKVYRIRVVDVLKNMDFVSIGLEHFIVENYGVNL
ncbi:endonuclease domain-containing protein [Nubsella zeaxanthinifaciens]|uniref:endonuclease domain-containing protein n=1 Tax=Nubsella zeaxanthinifaciens TaxID=392412 RepID=UPI000DE36F68|nr:DUF559 domain-containing protein [Nubsella zeaxanthinifaciens]